MDEETFLHDQVNNYMIDLLDNLVEKLSNLKSELADGEAVDKSRNSRKKVGEKMEAILSVLSESMQLFVNHHHQPKNGNEPKVDVLLSVVEHHVSKIVAGVTADNKKVAGKVSIIHTHIYNHV
jgi:hypothetical protein